MHWFQVLRYAVLPTSMVIFTILMASLCGNTWLYRFQELDTMKDLEERHGLWEVCMIPYNCGIPDKNCETTDLDTIPDFQQATRGFMILAVISAFFAMVVSITYYFKREIRAGFVGVIHIITAVFTLIAASVYTAKVNEGTIYEPYTYGWSHHFAWLGLIAAVAGVVMTFILEMPKRPIVHIEFRD